MRFYSAGGTAAIPILSTSIVTFLCFIQNEVAALRADGREGAFTDEPFLHLALTATAISIVEVPIITTFPSKIKLSEAIPTELLM
jgi:hypothetical protein